jgi:hypothetical protein
VNPFQSLRDYEAFVYTLPQEYPSILSSTLVLARRGRLYAELSGELMLAGGHRLQVYERLTWDDGPMSIEGYSYEAWQGSEKLYWYDSQAHPDDPVLAPTDPHHKHVPPEIKHHRIPAPGLSFTSANLPFLIQEIALSQ